MVQSLPLGMISGKLVDPMATLRPYSFSTRSRVDSKDISISNSI
jgi:hypothetical protein